MKLSAYTASLGFPLLPPAARLLCGLLLFACSYAAQGQSFTKFSHLTVNEGLSQNTVNCILKDRFGFMWFGTQDGLNQFDGYRFKIYKNKQKDSTSLSADAIQCLYEDSKGDLWVGTNGGSLNRYDRKNDRFVRFRESDTDTTLLSNADVNCIYEDSRGNFWVGTYWGLNLFDRKTGISKRFISATGAGAISHNNVLSILEDRSGKLWIGTENGLNLFDYHNLSFEHFLHDDAKPGSISSNWVSALVQDEKGNLWVGTRGGGLNLFDPGTRTFRAIKKEPFGKSISNDQVFSLLPAAKNHIWVGTEDGLNLFNADLLKSSVYGYSSENPHGLNNASVKALFADRSGILWIGTHAGGVNKLDSNLSFFQHQKHHPYKSNSLSHNVVTSFLQWKQGAIWIGTDGGGLNLYSPEPGSYQHFKAGGAQKSLSGNAVLALLKEDEERIWVGTYAGGLNLFDTRTNSFTCYRKGNTNRHLNSDHVFALLKDREGQVWIGTDGGGVNVLNPNTGVVRKYVRSETDSFSLSNNDIRALCMDKEGAIWIGTYAEGLNVYNPRSDNFTRFTTLNSGLSKNTIQCIFEDSRGNLWVGTLGGGLNLFDRATKTFTAFREEQGLASNVINSIVEDGKGTLWISTNRGLSAFDLARKVFKNYNVVNGLQSLEFSRGAGLLGPGGVLYFGGINGFNTISPGMLRTNRFAPPVAITNIEVFNRPLSPSGLNEGSVTLNYTQSTLSISFAALGYTVTEATRYAYKLEGFDDQWNYSEEGRTATYTNLPPGTYRFRVKAANNDGVWNNAGASFDITIMPPFWQTWWFRVSAALLFIASVFLFFRWRISSIRKQQRLLEQQVAERTARLARMAEELEIKNQELEQFAYVASHDLQEPLRTISSFVGVLQQQYEGRFDGKADKYMTFISQAAARMKVLISDLLEYSRIGRKKEWSLVNCNELMKELTEDLQAAIADCKAVVLWDDLPEVLGYRTELKQLLQNLVTNALKFRKKDTAPKIYVSATKEGDYWQFSVNDNGIGIDPRHSERIFIIFQRLHTRSEYEGSGIGLSNCRKIAELHQGKIWVDSVPGEGSSFYFTLRKDLGAEAN